MERLKPFFPKSHGKPRVDDRRVLSGIIFISRNGLRWCDVPRNMARQDPLKSLEAVGRQGRLHPDDGGAGLRGRRGEGRHDRRDLPESASHGFEPAGKKGGADDQRGRLIGRTKGGLNTKLHAVTDAKGRPLRFFMTAGQVSDYTGAAALLGSLPAADWLLADRGYDAGLVPGCVERQRDTPLHPRSDVTRKGCPLRQAPLQAPQPHRDHVRQLKDWRRIATRYDRCAKTFLSAVALAATVMFWL